MKEYYFLIIGALAGWLVNVLLRNLDRPALQMMPLEDSANTVSLKHKFIHVKILNKKRNWAYRLLFSNKASLFCKAQIQYLDKNGVELIPNALSGRWASTGEPVFQIGTDRIFQYNRVPELTFDHIMPGEHASLAVALKIEGEKEFFAFDNESYAYMGNAFKDPDKIIDQQIILVKIRIITSDGSYPEKTFQIHNPNDKLSCFKLKEKKYD